MSDFIKVAKRIDEMPAYIFSEINKIKEQARAKGMDLISLAIGDPDKATPPAVVEKMRAAIEKQPNHQYSPYDGTKAFREAAARFMQRRFGVSVDPASEVVALVGSKEGIAHLPLAFCDPGDNILYPTPGFPMYATTISMAGGNPIAIPLTFDKQFVPDLAHLKVQLERHKPKYLILNYPHNPTSAVISRDALKQIIDMAREHRCFVAFDNAYSEIYFDDNNKPISALEIPGAKDLCIEFHTLSKTFNMTGWRIAFAVGNQTLVQGLLKVKTNIDSGPFPATQEAAVYALDNEDAIASEGRQMYAARRKVALAALDKLGIEYLPNHATFYVWASVPNGQSSMDFCKKLIEEQGVVCTPGVGFGAEGEGFFRLALTVDVPRIEEAMKRLAKFLGR
ncbi:MAG: aminotransferase class I/II-fold pyridoxal phosphate-dependent enzyme [Bdellovibrionaceae bacterium]|nr:aminotransferase class I/II-fold pyridoxal phosphate-dependent enzyme [Bdellovibrionales bacterium]MCB9253155.1 aminotransferase class I/II-fold pyridoxal phosphate-dependent enzyme [Pseudobdellovibrionaceae bacterium]